MNVTRERGNDDDDVDASGTALTYETMNVIREQINDDDVDVSGTALTFETMNVRREQENDDDASRIEILRSNREIPSASRTKNFELYYRSIEPAHVRFKIASFSNLLKHDTPKFPSDKFCASGFNWRVSVYPKGRNYGDVDYLSMYLEIVDMPTTQDWEVHVSYKLFVYDRPKDMYHTIQEVDSKITHFHRMKTEWGFNRIMPLKTLKGCIGDNAYTFGAEVFVIKQCGLTKEVKEANPYTWKVKNFSTIKDEVNSQTFVVGGYSWSLLLYPNGNKAGKNKWLSLYLKAEWVKQNPKLRLHAEYTLRIKNKHNKTCYTRDTSTWFRSGIYTYWGFDEFVTHMDLNDKSKGFLYDGAIILEVEITTLSLIKK